MIPPPPSPKSKQPDQWPSTSASLPRSWFNSLIKRWNLRVNNDSPDPEPLEQFVTDSRGPLLPARYVVEAKLGSGGMGAVYRARDQLLGRTVAVKVIHSHALSPVLRERFLREAQAVARLDHPHVVKIFDVGGESHDWEGSPYLALEYVRGGTLTQRLAKQPLEPREAARLVRLLARAMAHAHERGVVHRDLKPDNVLLAPPVDEPALNTALGCPKISDFGLARQIDVECRLTRPGAVMGTPAFMAPEQAEGQEDVGPPTDVWALGVILYRMLTGKLPFESASVVDLLHKIRWEVPVPPRQVCPEVPVELEQICLACLEKVPGNRLTAEQLAEQLERVQTREEVSQPTTPPVPTRPVRSRVNLPRVSRRGLVLAAVVMLAGPGLLLGWWASRPGSVPPPAPPEPPLRITGFRVRVFEVKDDVETLPAGVISRDKVDAEERPLVSVPYDARVRIEAEFSAPAYAYLLAFNPDGRPPQVLWPLNASQEPDASVAPPCVEGFRYPDRRGSNGGNVLFRLNDEPRGGLQAFALVLSRAPLPPFNRWQNPEWTWTRLDGWKIPWLADRHGVYPVVPGEGTLRGQEVETKVPPLFRLLRELDARADLVEILAMPVLPREGRR